MTRREAIALIDCPYFRDLSGATHWADLGCGSGVFTLALAQLLKTRSMIEAIDLRPSIVSQTTPGGIDIRSRAANFVTDDLAFEGLDGIIMANSLHYVRDQRDFLRRIGAGLRPGGAFILIEYDTDRPVATWVPFPLSFDTAAALLPTAGFSAPERLGWRPSAFGRSNIYAALALKSADAGHASHDFDSISPSAYALLVMKALTPIPYAKEAAALLSSIRPSAAEPFSADIDSLDATKRNPGFWARVLHFESRYFSVDQLLSDLPATNMLELSSGFSFRGLALSRQRPVYYIDTDLPDLIATKRRFVETLANAPAAPPGHYELQPLNVLDIRAFEAIVQEFPTGELTIVNEGLLVYLDTAEKERLCRIIRDILLRRGGCWITGDIYLRSSNPNIFGEKSDAFLKFIEQHNIEENKFASFDDASAFFTRMGFTVEREANIDFGTLSALPHLLAAATPQQLERLRDLGRTRIHAVWRLRAV